LRIIHAIPWSKVDSQFPNTILTELVITEIPALYPVNPTLNSNPPFEVLQRVEPQRQTSPPCPPRYARHASKPGIG
jgi:hypothetical protein